MRRVGFHPGARKELRESVGYYETQQEGLGKRFLAAVRAAIERIQSYPLMCRTVEHDFRQRRVLRFPYGLIFRLGEDRILIDVMHLHRKPGYWKHRIREL